MANYLLGLDLGQQADYTAIAILEQRPGPGGEEFTYAVRHLERPPLGTLYPAIVARVQQLMQTPALAGHVTLGVDATGVGAGVIDMFHLAGVPLTAVTITAGEHVVRDGTAVRVPKRDLVAVLTVLFQTGRLSVARELALAPTLVGELLSFKLKIDPVTAHDSYGAWRAGQHDDLVLAVAIAAWQGECATGYLPSAFASAPRPSPFRSRLTVAPGRGLW